MGRGALLISGALVEAVIKDGVVAARPVANRLPDDARLVDARYDNEQRGVVLVFESSEYPTGDEPQLLKPVQFMRGEPNGSR